MVVRLDGQESSGSAFPSDFFAPVSLEAGEQNPPSHVSIYQMKLASDLKAMPLTFTVGQAEVWAHR